MVVICPQSLIATMFLLAAPSATPEAQNEKSLVIDTDFAVLRRGPGRDTVLDALVNTQAVLFRGDRCTRETPETTYWTCEVDGVSMSGVVDSGTLKLDGRRLDVQMQLRAAGGNGRPRTPQQERFLVLSSFAGYRAYAPACSTGDGARCDDALQTRINLFATAHALDGSRAAHAEFGTFNCLASVEASQCIQDALGAGVIGLGVDEPLAFAWAKALDARRVRFVLGRLERQAEGMRVVTTVDENVEDGLFPRSVGAAFVPLGFQTVLNSRLPRGDGVARLLFTETPPTCHSPRECAAGTNMSVWVQRRFLHDERLTVVCSDRVVRTVLATPKLQVMEVDDYNGTAPAFGYALPCTAVGVLLGDTPEIADGPLKPLGRNVRLPAAPPWGGCVSGARDEGHRGCRLLWSGDLNRDGVVDVIIRRVGEMGCGEHQLWLSTPGGGWRVAAANDWYC